MIFWVKTVGIDFVLILYTINPDCFSFIFRYNISTDDYDPFDTNSSHNQNL